MLTTNKTIDVYITGHVFDADLSKVEFVFDANTGNIENGEILLTEDKKNNKIYFLRVNNIRYGQNPNWSQEIARGYNSAIRQNDLHNEHTSPGNVYRLTREEQLFHVAECEILGVSDGKKFYLSRQLPPYFSEVKKLSKKDLEVHLSDFVGDLKIGYMRSGSNVLPISAGIFKNILPKHVGVIARTGGGKSETIKTLIGAMIDTRGEVNTLILEPHGEYINELKRHPLANEQLVIYNQDGRNGDRKIRISYSRISVESVLSLGQQMRWTEPQERLLYEVYSRFGKSWFKKMVELPAEDGDLGSILEEEDDKEPFSFVDDYSEKDDFGRPIEEKSLKGYFPNVNTESLRATQAKLKRLAKSIFLTPNDNQDDLDEVFKHLNNGKTVLIDTGRLLKLEELFISSLLAGELLKRRKNAFFKDPENFKSNFPITGIVLEEAQRVLGRNENSESNIFLQIVGEGRKFHCCLIPITQRPTAIDSDILSQINTLIILGINDEDHFDVLKRSAQSPLAQLKREVKQLMPGEAIISSPGLPFALPLKIFLYDDFIKYHSEKPSTDIRPPLSSFDGFN